MNTIEPSSVKGIIFDLDGTLYRMEWFFRPLMWFKSFPHPMRLPRFIAERSRIAGVDFGSRDTLLSQLCSTLAKREHTTPEAIKNWILNKFYPAFISTMPLQRSGRRNLNETLSRLKRHNVKLAVLSDYHAVVERLEKLKIGIDVFDIITSCEMKGALKPSSRPFLEIASQWNLSTNSILVIGDREDTDGEAARNAEMQFLLLSKNKNYKNSMPWSEVCRILNSLNGC
jgi:HAD superfamily hydrolase (TIGR01549 family)